MNIGDIDGWFDWPRLYQFLVNDANDGDHFVEVGTYFGKSAVFMGEMIKRSNKKIKFDTIDSYLVFEEEATEKEIGDFDNERLDKTIQNIKSCGVKEYVNLIVGSSPEITSNYDDDSLEAVYLDGDHRYEIVLSEILQWYPKIKIGGMICGHDILGFYGVQKAVIECFGNQFSTAETSWMYRKCNNDQIGGFNFDDFKFSSNLNFKKAEKRSYD